MYSEASLLCTGYFENISLIDKPRTAITLRNHYVVDRHKWTGMTTERNSSCRVFRWTQFQKKCSWSQFQFRPNHASYRWNGLGHAVCSSLIFDLLYSMICVLYIYDTSPLRACPRFCCCLHGNGLTSFMLGHPEKGRIDWPTESHQYSRVKCTR